MATVDTFETENAETWIQLADVECVSPWLWLEEPAFSRVRCECIGREDATPSSQLQIGERYVRTLLATVISELERSVARYARRGFFP